MQTAFILLSVLGVSRSAFSFESSRWTGYSEDYFANNSSKLTLAMIKNPNECMPYKNSIITNQRSSRHYGLWRQFESIAGDSGELLFGFREAIDVIWKNQNPPDCSKAKYLIQKYHQGGFGSLIHVAGSSLSLSIKLGRVYLEDPQYQGFPDNWILNSSHCQLLQPLSARNNFQCYYRSWSKCTLKDAYHVSSNQSLDHSHVKTLETYIRDFNEIEQRIGDARTVRMNHPVVPNPEFYYDVRLERILKCSPIKPEHYFYWWRAVSASYLLRPNKETLRWLHQHSMLYPVVGTIDKRQECVGMYVRHGDKGREMKLLEFTDFSVEVLKLWRSGYFSSKPNVFVGTEDPRVIEDAVAWGKKEGFNIIYTDLYDRSTVSAVVGGDGNVHDDKEYLSILLNLKLLLECNAWICQTGSNFCRLVDELRATVMNKANFKYIDLGTTSCPKWDGSLCW